MSTLSEGYRLRGESPPFSVSGRSGTAIAQVPFQGAEAGEANQIGHRGILLRWRVDRDAAASLLPHPLEAIDETGDVLLLVTQTQSARSEEFLAEAHPALISWNEASLMIPCRHGDEEGVFTWVRYVDVDHGVLSGAYSGIATKMARFGFTLPFGGQPLNREMGPGVVSTATASRFDRELFTVTFKGEAELDAAPAPVERLQRRFGVRYMPDWEKPAADPLVDDLVAWDLGDWRVHRSWSGAGSAAVTASDDDELQLLAPEQILESWYVELEYTEGPGMCRQVAAKAPDEERRAANGTILRGASTPFTPSGLAALGRSTDLGGEEGDELTQAGHMGIYVHWRVDPDKVAQLLPWPLEPNENTDKVWLFMNQTQSGINRHNNADKDSLDYLATLRPHHVNWHEAMFRIPCSYKGEECYLLHVQYKDRDHGIVLGLNDSFTTKLADFHTTFPMTGHPYNREMAAGSRVQMVLSRFNERIMTASFTAERELSREEIHDENINIVGVRYFPDYTGANKPPLVHDLLNFRFVNRSYHRAWIGDAHITFGESEYEELHLLEPVEMLQSLYVYLQYQGGPGTGGVFHDYTRDGYGGGA